MYFDAGKNTTNDLKRSTQFSRMKSSFGKHASKTTVFRSFFIVPSLSILFRGFSSVNVAFPEKLDLGNRIVHT